MSTLRYTPNSNRILPQSTGLYNGRVNIIEPENPNARFQMFERIAVQNKATPYREAILGDWEDNLLSRVFFSAGNIQIVQNGLRAGVYAKSKEKFVIPPQSIENLKVIMRNIFLQYVNYVEDKEITKEVERLNQLVWNYTIPMVYGECMGYMKYLQDQSSLVVPLELPQQPDRVYKQLEPKPWF